MTGPAPLLSAERLSVDLTGRPVLIDIDLAIRAGEVLAIVGPNGAGKTTLIRALAGIIPARGTIRLGDRELSAIKPAVRARRIAYLPQGHQFYWPMPVREIVGLGRLPHGAGASLSATDRAAVAEAMAECGVTEFADRPVTTLSGGERSRVALARILAVQSEIILADEPTASLDPYYQLSVLGLLRLRAETGRAVAIVLHDFALASRFADRVALLAEGRLARLGTPAEVLTGDGIGEAFGVSTVTLEHDGIRVAIPWAIKPPA
jgi:iron complex transport system ATP-binding protein